MKLGMIFECGPDGADKQVCIELARRLAPTSAVSYLTLDNKPKLIRDCGLAAQRLLADSCDRILIVWDLYPAWRSDGASPCRKVDRDAIFASLSSAKVRSSSVGLICIKEELEAWLIADGRAVTQVLSKPHRQVKVSHAKNVEQISNPKVELNRTFQQLTGRQYVDRLHAIQIARALPDFTRLRRIPSFGRFCSMLGCNPP